MLNIKKGKIKVVCVCCKKTIEDFGAFCYDSRDNINFYHEDCFDEDNSETI